MREAQAIGTVGNLEVSVRDIVVADQASAIDPDNHRRESTDIAFILNGSVGCRTTLNIDAMGDSEIPIGRIVVTDQTSAVRTDGHRRESTNITLTVKGADLG